MVNDKYVIISPCPTRTGSTFLFNAVCGFIGLNVNHRFVQIAKWRNIEESTKRKLDVVKTHSLNMPEWIEEYQKFHEDVIPYFISMEREETDKFIPKEYKVPNLIIIQYKEILETEDYSVEAIVDHLYEKIRTFLPDDIILHKDQALTRLVAMNAVVERLKDEPFNVHNKYFHIHGHHRNRDENPNRNLNKVEINETDND